MELVYKALVFAVIGVVVVVGLVFPYKHYATSDVGKSFTNTVTGASQLLTDASGSITMMTGLPFSGPHNTQSTAQHTPKTPAIPKPDSGIPAPQPEQAPAKSTPASTIPAPTPSPATTTPEVTVTVPPPTPAPVVQTHNDLKISLISNEIHLTSGTSTQVTLVVTGSDNSPFLITTSSTNPNLVAEPGRNNLAPPKNVNLIITTPGRLPNGTYHITIKATQGGSTSTADLTVIVP